MKQLVTFMMMGAMGLVVSPAFADTCGNQTISNKKLHKLEVTTGTCIADNVTVNGGITVDGGAHLQLTNATVNGGINVQPNGELDLQNTTNGAGQPVPGSSVINGGIVVNNAFDLDLRGSVIHGGVSITGTANTNSQVDLCNLDIRGGLTVTNVRNNFGMAIGGGALGTTCSGNKIDGSVVIDNSGVAALDDTTINGSLLCINGGVVSSNSGNSITGSNTCY